MRDCCYECKFRDNHFSDITLADFWGYRELDASINDEKGISLLIANTEKGLHTVEKLQNFNLYSVDNKYTDYVYAPRDYSAAYEKKKTFVALWEQVGFEKAAKKIYMQDYLKRLVKYYIKRALGCDMN